MSKEVVAANGAIMILRIPEELRETFAREANKRGYTLSEGVRLAMKAWMVGKGEVAEVR